MKVTKRIYTETAHRLMNHPGACANLHGHSYLWEVTLNSPVHTMDPVSGMLMDFSHIKSLLKTHIENVFDHVTVLCSLDPLRSILYPPAAPAGLRIFTMPGEEHPTAENFAAFAAKHLSRDEALQEVVVTVKCWETTTSYAEATAHRGELI